MVRSIYKLILDAYPFLTVREEELFKDKASRALDEVSKFGQLETSQRILSFLDNQSHTDIKEYVEPTTEQLIGEKAQKWPTFSIDNEILYVNIPSWVTRIGRMDKALISYCVKHTLEYKAIVLDVRGNVGGNSKLAHNFAGIFFRKRVLFGRFYKRIRTKGIRKEFAKLEPNGKFFIDKPIVILVSKKCFSSTELFVAPFKISKRATLIGRYRTGGGSACPLIKKLTLDRKKYVVRIPTWRFFLRGKGKPIEATGIEPDVWYQGEDIEGYAREYASKMLSID